jgi:acetoin utilization deacetylase AcuC-like enzyme
LAVVEPRVEFAKAQPATQKQIEAVHGKPHIDSVRQSGLYDIAALAAGGAVQAAANRSGGGCFGILEGGYNHQVLGQNVMALIEGLSSS